MKKVYVNVSAALTGVRVPPVRARIIGPEVVAKGIASNGALREIRHAVVILLVLHVYPVPVDRVGAAKHRVVNVH